MLAEGQLMAERYQAPGCFFWSDMVLVGNQPAEVDHTHDEGRDTKDALQAE